MRRDSWEDLLDDQCSSSLSFIFTAATLKMFIDQHCKDPLEATQSILAHAECIPQSSYESSCAAIPRRRPRSLAFPFLDLPPELITTVAKNAPIGLKSGLGSLAMASKSVRELTFPFLFSSLEIGPSRFITQRSGFWEHYPGLAGTHPKELRISLCSDNKGLQQICNDVGRLSENGWNNRIRHISISTCFPAPHAEYSEQQRSLVQLGQILKDFDHLTSLELDCHYDFVCLEALLWCYPKTLVYLRLPYLDDTIGGVLSNLPSLRILEYSTAFYDNVLLETTSSWKFGIQELRVHSSKLTNLNILLEAASATLKSLILSQCSFPENWTLDLPQMDHLSYVWFDGVSGPASYFCGLLDTKPKRLRYLRLWLDEESGYQDSYCQDLIQDILDSRRDNVAWGSLDTISFNETAWILMVANWWTGSGEFADYFKRVGITVVKDFNDSRNY